LNRRSNTWNVSLVGGTFDLNLCENWRSYHTKYSVQISSLYHTKW